MAQGALEVALKVTNDMSGSTQLNVTTSHTRQRNQWGWNYRSEFFFVLFCMLSKIHIHLPCLKFMFILIHVGFKTLCQLYMAN